jgi:hypothetical protein
LGEAAAAEDIAATVQPTDMLDAGLAERTPMYPAGLHGLTALVYAVVGLADKATIAAAIDVMANIRNLSTLRPGHGFAKLPLGELTTYGFELLIEKALAEGLQEAFRSSKAYAAEREDVGLA